MFSGGRSVVVYALFIYAAIICGGGVGPCFDMQYFVSFLVLQSSRWERESWIHVLYFLCLLDVMLLLLFSSSSYGVVLYNV